MLSLNINEKRTLDFEVQLAGINPDQLQGALRFKINGIEYGFQAEFKDESISVNIPPLNNIVIDTLREGATIKASLEVNGNGFFLNPWNGEFTISNPVKLEATIIEDDNYLSDNIPKVNVSKVITEEDEFDLEESIQEKLKETFAEKIIEPIIKKKKKPIQEKVIKPKSKPKQQLMKNITEDQIYQFMSYMGTKNKRVQDILFEQAKDVAISDEPKDIFKEVYKRLKRK